MLEVSDSQDDPFQAERNTLHRAIQEQAKRLKNNKKTIRELKQRIALDVNGVFVTLDYKQIREIMKEAFADTIDAHGNTIKDHIWIWSFRKRFWGRIKSFVHNQRSSKQEDFA